MEIIASCLDIVAVLETLQRAKKVVLDSPGLVDFAIGLVNFVLNGSFLRNSSYRRTVKSTLLIKMFLGLVGMTFGLVYASFSLREWQGLKMTFFAPCLQKHERFLSVDR